MIARVNTTALVGIDAVPVTVEVEVRGGQPRFSLIGLGDSAVRESRERVSAALTHSGFRLPEQILVSLAPAEVRKEGSSFDLPIALGVLVASGQVAPSSCEGVGFLGELGLDGNIRPVRGVLASVIGALRSGLEEVVVPPQNLREARLISGIRVSAVARLVDLVRKLRGEEVDVKPPEARPTQSGGSQRMVSEVIGQDSAKRAMLIAAAGAHNLLMVGPPGCGKSMLAERFSSLVPSMTLEETLDVVRVHSIMGSPVEPFLDGVRPYRAPHHGVSDVGLIGGGSPVQPGEVTLAHNGVLFLDEFPEFRRGAIESLRAPLETGVVHIARAKSRVRLPARVQLLAAMNPCPCGRLGSRQGECTCAKTSIMGYLKKLSQPILERIDVQVELDAVSLDDLMRGGEGRDLEAEEARLRGLVRIARERQLIRAGKLNARLSNREVTKAVSLTRTTSALVEKLLQKSALSARGYMRLMKLALTISDLEGATMVEPHHIAEAVGMRSLDRLARYLGGGDAVGSPPVLG